VPSYGLGHVAKKQSKNNVTFQEGRDGWLPCLYSLDSHISLSQRGGAGGGGVGGKGGGGGRGEK
jgi:hypothetical protein